MISFFLSILNHVWHALIDAKELVAAIAGALVGGWAIYKATAILEKRKQEGTILRLYGLLLLELIDHHANLFLEIDQFLPSWILRGHSFRKGVDSIMNLHFTWLHLRLSKLNDEYYSRFISELIHADLIVELEAYYRSVRSHNHMIADWSSSRALDSVQPYVRNTLRLFDSGMYLVKKMRDTPRVTHHFVDAHKLELKEFDLQQEQHNRVSALANLRFNQLVDLEAVKQWEDADEKMRENWRRVGMDQPHADGVPVIIRNDPDRLWRNYLAEARKILARP